MYDFTTLGAIVGLVIAIVLIIKKVQPAYSLILGALIKTGAAEKIAETIVEKLVLQTAVSFLL